MIILRIRPRNKKIWPGEIQNFENQEIHMVVHAPSRMTKSGEEGLLTIVTTFVSEIYFSMWFLESSCGDDSEYVPNLPPTMYFFRATGVQSENPTFLGVRSTNPLPSSSSGLVKLATCRVATTCRDASASKKIWFLQNSVKFGVDWIFTARLDSLCLCLLWRPLRIFRVFLRKYTNISFFHDQILYILSNAISLQMLNLMITL